MDINKMFTYHPPKPGDKEKFDCITAAAKYLAQLITVNCPDSAEASLAIRKVQEARMWANASIVLTEKPLLYDSRNQPDVPTGFKYGLRCCCKCDDAFDGEPTQMDICPDCLANIKEGFGC